MTTPTHVILDLDGTLLDSRPGIVESLRHTQEALGIHLTDDEITAWIGPSIYASFARALGTADPDRVQAAVSAYRDRYEAVGIHQCRPYEGVHTALAALRRAGARLWVASAKARPLVQRMTAHWELDAFLEDAYGSGLDGSLAEKGDLLAHILEERGLPPGSCVMVGDRASDITGSVRNGVRAVAARWGYGSRAELEAAGAAEWLEQPADLPQVLDPLRDGSLRGAVAPRDKGERR
jgi:phosphoglycolate phosphatase